MRQHPNRKQFANFSNLMRKINPPFVRPRRIYLLLKWTDAPLLLVLLGVKNMDNMKQR